MTQAQNADVQADKKPSAALCRRFAAQGYHVFVAGRTSGKIDEVAHTSAGAGGSAEAIVTEVTSPGCSSAPWPSRDFAGLRANWR